MSQTPKVFLLANAENCSAAASTTTVGALSPDVGTGWTSIEAFGKLLGPTGGTLDVYVQDSIDNGVEWRDWAHFTQCVAATASKQHLCAALGNSNTVIGIGTAAAPAVALAAASVRPGHPGPKFRVVYVTGTGVTVAAAQTIWLECRRSGQ